LLPHQLWLPNRRHGRWQLQSGATGFSFSFVEVIFDPFPTKNQQIAKLLYSMDEIQVGQTEHGKVLHGFRTLNVCCQSSGGLQVVLPICFARKNHLVFFPHPMLTHRMIEM
jgi:hypothetical protein